MQKDVKWSTPAVRWLWQPVWQNYFPIHFPNIFSVSFPIYCSDLNPGSCFSGSIPLLLSLAALNMHMTPGLDGETLWRNILSICDSVFLEEIVTAITINGAAAINRANTIGRWGSIFYSNTSFYRNNTRFTALIRVKKVTSSSWSTHRTSFWSTGMFLFWWRKENWDFLKDGCEYCDESDQRRTNCVGRTTELRVKHVMKLYLHRNGKASFLVTHFILKNKYNSFVTLWIICVTSLDHN